MGYFFITQILIQFDGSDVGHHELTVVDSSRNLIIGMDFYFLHIKNDIELLATFLGCEVPGLELPTDDLSVLSSHDLNTRTGPTVNTGAWRAACLTDIFAAAIRPRVPVLRLAEEDTMSGRHHDEGARGAGQDGDPA